MAEAKIPAIRKSNIELLKIFCMIGVVVLHFNNSDTGGCLDYATKPLNYGIVCFFQQLSYIAVDTLVIISGFFLSQKNSAGFVKPIILLIQVILFKEGLYLMSCFMKKTEFSVSGVLEHLIPCSYYVILYIALYLISPLINKALIGLGEKKLAKMVLLVFALFSVEPWIADVLEKALGISLEGLSFISNTGSGKGYTIVNFVLCYIVGYWIRNGIDINKIKTGYLFAAFGFVYAFNLACYVFMPVLRIEYCSPFVIIQAALTFCLFLKPDFSNKVVNSLAKASFTVYLLNYNIIRLISGLLHKVAAGNPFLMIAVITALCIAVYLLCYIVYLIYDFLINKMILNRIVKKFELERKMRYTIE